MRCPKQIGLILAVFLGGLPGPEAVSAQQATKDTISELVGRLGDRDFGVRSSAFRRLETIGEEALPALRSALADPSLEVVQRAQQLIATILASASKSKTTGLELVLLPSGEFQMGSPMQERGRQADEVQHRVRITRPFLLGKYEVTQEEYRKVVQAMPGWFASTGSGADKVSRMDTRRFPVEKTTWFDAIEFCNRLGKLDGYPPYYRLEVEDREKGGIRKARVEILGGNGYRLPTEAEWEYACRAGSTTPFHFGKILVVSQANARGITSISYGTRSTGLGRTTKVGSFRPNGWGLHDMHGNVAEWCWDRYSRDGYGQAPRKDPVGPATGTHRVLRGGSWLVTDQSCRSASRYWQEPGKGAYFAGFRVARTP